MPASIADEHPRPLVEDEREVAVGAGAYCPAPVAREGDGVAKPVGHHADAAPLLHNPAARIQYGRAEGGP